jgi:hypothetical protein
MMTDSHDREMAKLYTLAMTWYRRKVREFQDQQNPDAVAAVDKEYDLWPNQRIVADILKTVLRSPVESQDTSQDFIDALLAATRSMAPNVTLKEAAYHTSASPYWNLTYKVVIHPPSDPAVALAVFRTWLEREVPGSKVKYVQKHFLSSHYWNVDVEVPVG